MIYQVNIYMAFGLNINFTGIIGDLTNSIRSIAGAKISSLSNMVKTVSINNVTNGLVGQIQGMIGTSLNLNMSKLAGGINFANALKGLPFPSLSNLNLNSLYGLIDNNIGLNLNKFAKGLASTYKNLNLDEINLGNKLSTAINSQINNITDEVQAGIIAGKSSVGVLDQLNNLSNRQIRDFTVNPQLQLDYVNDLVDQQKNEIFNLAFNTKPESAIFNDQIKSLQDDSLGSFSGETNLDFSFFDVKTIEEATISKNVVTEQKFQIANITKVENPLARKIDTVNRFNKEEETLNYLEFLNDDFESTKTVTFVDRGPVESSGLEKMIDPDTGEVLGYTDKAANLILDIDFNPV